MTTGDPPPSRDDDRPLRSRLVLSAQVAFVSALAVPVVGLVIAVRAPEPSTGGTAGAPGGSSSGGPGAVVPTVARVSLSTRGTAASPIVWQVRLGRDRNVNAVLTGYEAYLGTTVRLAEEPDPDDVALAQVALDPQLRLLRRVLAGGAASGVTRRGRVVATARVVGLRGDQAFLVGCVNTTAQILYGADGRPVARWHGGLSVSLVRLHRDDGRWKVYLVGPLPASRCRR